MEFEQINKQNQFQKWDLILKELNELLNLNSNFEYDELILKKFENVELGYREKNAIPMYNLLWKVAYRRGKVKLAKDYVDFFLIHLFEFKRIPLLTELQVELKATGLTKSYKKTLEVGRLIGKNTLPSKEQSTNENGSKLHPEMYRNSKEKIKNYLCEKVNWDLDDWKICYEFIIKFYFDKEIFIRLYNFSLITKKEKFSTPLEKLFLLKKVNNYRLVNPIQKTLAPEDKNLVLDYDQLALSLMSGNTKPEEFEQKRIMVFIAQLNDEEFLTRGKDMAIAFSFLGMDLIVAKICQRLIPLMTDLKDSISTYYVLGEALVNSEQYYETIDLVDDLQTRLPLNTNEIIAFEYLRAESYFYLGKKSRAKSIFLTIKKMNSNYRMVNIRLKVLESVK